MSRRRTSPHRWSEDAALAPAVAKRHALSGFYGFIEQPHSQVTVETILALHRERTVQRMRTGRTVLCLHDGSDLRFATRRDCEGLEVNHECAPYPNELMTAFNLELDRWIRDGRALQYFRKKDGDAILPIQEITAALPPPPEEKEKTP